MNKNKKIGENITKFRKAKGLTMPALADKCGVSRSLMSQVLHEHIEPTDSLKLKMAEVLNTDTLILFGGK